MTQPEQPLTIDAAPAEKPTRKVLMSPELMEQWATRDLKGNLLVWDWHELSDAGLFGGFWEPTVTVDRTDNLIRSALTELRAAVEGLHLPLGMSFHLDRARDDALAAVIALIDERLR